MDEFIDWFQIIRLPVTPWYQAAKNGWGIGERLKQHESGTPYDSGPRSCRWEVKIMKNGILLTVLSLATASGTLFAQPRFSVGIGIGGEAPQYYDQAPPAYAPAPDYGYDSNESAYDSGSNYDYQPPS